jgi:hypothetical protein
MNEHWQASELASATLAIGCDNACARERLEFFVPEIEVEAAF